MAAGKQYPEICAVFAIDGCGAGSLALMRTARLVVRESIGQQFSNRMCRACKAFPALIAQQSLKRGISTDRRFELFCFF